MIKKPTLKTKDAVEVQSPEYKDGSTFIPNQSVDMTNSGTDLNQTASGENLSAKFKHPRVSQDIPSAGRGQYQDPK
jgi:hypothetical protein